MPLQHNSDEGTLTVDGISLNNAFGAWGVYGDKTGQGGLLKLWNDFDVRGDDRILPSATGVIAYERRVTATRHDLTLTVVGDVNGQTGATVMDCRVGLQDNMDYLMTNVILPPGTSTGTRSASLSMFSGGPRTADIHVLRTTTQLYHIDECGSIWVATLHISIPGGRFS